VAREEQVQRLGIVSLAFYSLDNYQIGFDSEMHRPSIQIICGALPIRHVANYILFHAGACNQVFDIICCLPPFWDFERVRYVVNVLYDILSSDGSRLFCSYLLFARNVHRRHVSANVLGDPRGWFPLEQGWVPGRDKLAPMARTETVGGSCGEKTKRRFLGRTRPCFVNNHYRVDPVLLIGLLSRWDLHSGQYIAFTTWL
jgi:hypothetical protein